jgi:shikimate kinase
MGSGKSTVGPILANTLGYTYCDLDAVIELRTGATIAALFRDRGEAEFRTLELENFRNESGAERVVIALGGGALTDPETMAHAKATGVLVYLQTPLDDIMLRLGKKTDRPLLLATDGAPLDDRALRDRVRALLAAREPAYLTADIIVSTAGGNLGRTVDQIARELSRFLPR